MPEVKPVRLLMLLRELYVPLDSRRPLEIKLQEYVDSGKLSISDDLSDVSGPWLQEFLAELYPMLRKGMESFEERYKTVKESYDALEKIVQKS